jgi:hypothetical protein
MLSLAIAAALAAQYPSPQAPQYGAPMPQYAAPQTYSVPVQFAAPQVTMLGAGAVVPPGPFGMFLGHLGRKLEQHSWPRVQPMMAQPAMQQTVYLQMSAPMVQQAVYTVPAPVQYQSPPVYGAPVPPMKNPPTQTYGSPQAQQSPPPNPYGATKPSPASEAAPPVPRA